MGQPASQIDQYYSDDGSGHDKSGLEDLTQEEVMSSDSSAEHSLRLWEAPRPENVAASRIKAPNELPIPTIEQLEYNEYMMNGHLQPSITKQMNHYIRKHPFFAKSLATFTKSERRQFERNVYDFARGLGLKKAEATRHVVKAREFCGEVKDDNDSSTFEGETDDSRFILETLSASNLHVSAAVSVAIDLSTRQVDTSDKTRAAHDIPTKSGEDAAAKSAGTNARSKRRKAKAGGKDRDNETTRTLLKLSNTPDFPTNVREDAASKSAGTNPASKKRKAKVGDVDDDYESARALRMLSAAPDFSTNVGEDAASMSAWTNPVRKKRKAKAGDVDSNYESARKSMELSVNVPAQEAGDRIDKGTRKGRKRRRHRREEMPVDVIPFSGDAKTKSSTQRNPASREHAPDEPSSLLPEVQKMEQQDF